LGDGVEVYGLGSAKLGNLHSERLVLEHTQNPLLLLKVVDPAVALDDLNNFLRHRKPTGRDPKSVNGQHLEAYALCLAVSEHNLLFFILALFLLFPVGYKCLSPLFFLVFPVALNVLFAVPNVPLLSKLVQIACTRPALSTFAQRFRVFLLVLEFDLFLFWIDLLFGPG
jgi:hypothetical protein